MIEVKSIDDKGVVTLRGWHAKLYVCVGEKGKVKAQVIFIVVIFDLKKRKVCCKTKSNFKYVAFYSFLYN